MKQTIAFLFIAATVVLSCNNEPKKETQSSELKDSTTAVENKIMIPVSGCYSNISGKDSVHLKLEVFPNVVTGNLSYKFHEKDANKGELEGTLKGDTLIADYKFMSEGAQSTRQVIFLVKDSIAVEGYGNMEEKNGKLVFKDVKDVTFAKGMQLKKVSCN